MKLYNLLLCVVFALLQQHVSSQVMSSIHTPASEAKKEYDFGVVIDLGSGGSRAAIFTWPQESKNPSYVDVTYAPYDDPDNPYYTKIKPDIATFKNNPVAAGPYMKPLFDFIVDKVPGKKLQTTPVFIKGTEGLRALGTPCQKILDSVYYYASQNYNFLINQSFISTISGTEEGAYGWISINKLLGNFDSESSIMGALDMGHGSTQISFIPDDVASIPPSYQFNFTYLDDKYTIYTHSFSGYGKTKALYAANNTALIGQSSANFVNPCMLTGFSYDVLDTGASYPVHGSSDWIKCKTVTYDILNKTTACPLTPCSYNGAFQPPLVGNFWAISNYVDIESFLDLGKDSTPEKIFAATGKFCGLTWEEAQRKYSSEDRGELALYCFGGNYLASLLGNGYGFPSNFDIHFDSKVDAFPATWALGEMVIELQRGW